MDRLDRSKYQVFEIIKYAHRFDRAIPEYDYDDRMREYYRTWANRTVDFKTYYFTDRTMERVSMMDYSKLAVGDFMTIYAGQPEKGAVVTSGNYGLLNFGYVVTPHHIILGVYSKAVRVMDSVLMESGQTSDYGFMSRFLGNVIISGSGITYNVNSALTVIERVAAGDNTIAHNASVNVLRRCKLLGKEMQRIGGDHSRRLVDYDDRELDAAPNLRYEVKAYKERSVQLVQAVKMFLFLKTASIIDKTYISEPPACTYRRVPGVKLGYIRVDSTWDSDITVLNPFMVRGHFRRQVCGKGRADRKLIYIDAFMKKGYHRRATKALDEINQQPLR